jgi:hypothetical protein
MVWTRGISIVADAADGADGVMQLVLAYGRYPDRPHSQSALAAEHNFQSRVCGGSSAPGAAGQRVRVDSLASQTGAMRS